MMEVARLTFDWLEEVAVRFLSRYLAVAFELRLEDVKRREEEDDVFLRPMLLVSAQLLENGGSDWDGSHLDREEAWFRRLAEDPTSQCQSP
jgi:hypothetical protein